MKWNETRISKCPLKSAEQLFSDWDIIWENVHLSLDYPDVGLVYFLGRKGSYFTVVHFVWNHEHNTPEEFREIRTSRVFYNTMDLIAWLTDCGPKELGTTVSARMLESVKGL